MAETKFTQMQQAAIDVRNRNVLVSAAAGSGKTAVLVQRIINRILDENDPVDIDRILVMTFTKAAAAQMKERILNAINEKRIAFPDNKNLNRQYALVHNANIVTIDSFCSSVVRNHFEEIGLSPDFRVADEGELTLLKQDVLKDVLESFYEEGEDAFLEMTEVFSTDKTDDSIEKIILSMFEYARSYPDPSEWLKNCAAEYEINDEEFNPQWLTEYVRGFNDELMVCRQILDEAAEICGSNLGPFPYLAAIESDIEAVDAIIGAGTYSEIYEKCERLSDYKFKTLGRVSSVKSEEITDAEWEESCRLKERVKEMRDFCKKNIKAIIDTVLMMNSDEIKAGMKSMAAPVKTLTSVINAFDESYSESKREKNIVDFSDLEHMCLRILSEGKDTTAKAYRDFFVEIYVDEYQDSNYVQEEILNLICSDSAEYGNVFMVGDVKQSIYGFRMAKPEIFIGKYNRYEGYSSEKDNGRDVRVDLSHNFRSRREVINSVNSIFRRIMTRRLGGIEYDDNAALHQGKEFEVTGSNYNTELKVFISDESINDKEAEAMLVAGEIKKLMAECQVTSDEGIRPLRYSDIVILLRSAKGFDNVLMDVLKGQGIPAFVSSSTGYFDAMEVRVILNFLKIIDNPLQDIPLASVMTSVIGNFYEDELAIIRGSFKNGYLFNALTDYVGTYDNALSRKINGFIELLTHYREKTRYSAVSEILTEIIDSDYGKIVSSMPSGKKRIANLNMLLKKAMEFGETSYKGIFHFNRYIEAIRKYEVDFGEANIFDENDDTVRIMTIHKSKGLEFPVCFLCGMSKGFNGSDTKASVLADSKYGVATDFINHKRRIKTKSPFKQSVIRKKKEENIAEELRLLYVAMTRAKEKLIMTGVIKKENALTDSLVTIEKANSYIDMYKCAADGDRVSDIDLTYVTAGGLVNESVEDAVSLEVERNRLLSLIDGDKIATDIEEICDRLTYVYLHEDRGTVKLSVSELKHLSDKQEDTESEQDNKVTKHLYEGYEPGQVNSSALHGTAVHRIFEIWDYNLEPSKESVESFLEYVHKEELIEEELYNLIRVDEVLDFVSSDIAARMKAAYANGELYREQPFVISESMDDPESMLIQGIIDAFFVENGEIVLVDYKTDRGKSEKQLVEDHGTQLAYYAKALNRMLHLKIKESVIYSTYLRKAIII